MLLSLRMLQTKVCVDTVLESGEETEILTKRLVLGIFSSGCVTNRRLSERLINTN